MNKKIGFTLFAAILLLLTTTAFSLAIPGMIEAEVYNNGGEGVGFHTTDGSSPVTETNSDSPGNGLQIAYIDAGEWLAYTVNPTAGFYNVEVRVAKDPSAPAGGAFHIEFGGVDVTGIQTVPSTGSWTTFATMVIGPIEITSSGSQTMKFFFDGGPFNFNWVNFVSTSESPSPSPSPTPAPTVSPNPAPVSALHVEGQWIKNDAGSNVTLRGVAIGDLNAIYKGDRKTDSTQTTPITVQDIIDKGSTSDWHIDIWRLPIHADVNDETGHHGWNVVNNPQWFFDNIIDPAVSKVISVGKYVIVDWHYVGVSWDDATVIAKTEEFWLGNGAWTGIAAHYANNPNVLFELFNEPGGGSWSSWKTRSSGWINRIRGIGANNIIIVGGPGWSQTLPQSAGDLISATNIVYACHIYPQHVSGTVPNWIEYTSSVAPVMMTEWGFENTGPAPVGGTAAAYGATYKAYINSKPNVSWIGWCFDYIYHSYWFDTNWTLLGNGQATASTLYFGASGVDKGVHGITAPADTSQNFMGQFVKNWLAEAATGSTLAPTAVPTAAPTLAPTAVPTAVPTAAPVGSISIAVGSSSAVGSFQADQYYSGGTTYNTTNTVDISQITSNPPPAALFNNERYGAMTYTIPGFTSGNSYTVTLYFAETYFTASGSRLFNVSINGTTALSSFDIYAIAGGQNKAIAQSFTTTADSSGQIVIQFISGTENPKINGISINPGGGTVTAVPTAIPTAVPTAVPTGVPTAVPTAIPTGVPTAAPTAIPTAVPTAAPTLAPGTSAFSKFEAENFTTQSGIQTESCGEGTLDIGFIENNDYIAFNNIDFGSGVASFEARIASPNSGNNIQIRLDSTTGTLIGTCPVPSSTGWQVWTTSICSVSGASGIHNLYLVFTGGSSYLFNVNWFQFLSSAAPRAPIVWTKFDETSGTSASDSSGNGKNGTLNGSPLFASGGKSVNMIDLSGSSQYVSMPAGLVSSLSDFSITFWVNLDTVTAWTRIFDFGTGTSAYMFITPKSTSGIRYAISTGGPGSEQQITGSAALPTGAWKFVAITLSGSTGILYVDGVEVGRNTSMSVKPNNLGSTGNNYIGKSQFSADPYLDGKVDEFKIYNAALSASDIQVLYNMFPH